MKKTYLKYFVANFSAQNILTADLKQLPPQIVNIFIDIDNTLASHGSRVADEYAVKAIKRLKAHNYQCCLLSNALSNRIADYAQSLQIDSLPQANKPAGKVIRQYLVKHQLKPEQCLIIGDQLFTDIWAANNAGCYSLLVQPRFQQELWNIKLKRRLEKLLVKLYGNPSQNIDLPLTEYKD